MNNNRSKKELLFITGEINIGSAQEVRYSGLIPSIKKRFNISLLTFRLDFSNDKDINHYSVIGSSKVFIFIVKSINRLLKKHIFPDVFSLYVNLYIRKIKKNIKRKKIDAIIIGVTPFSLLTLTEKIKKLDDQIPIYLDFSDPFSLNALLNEKQRKKALLLEKKYLSYSNKVFVVSDKMKEYYDTKLFNNDPSKTVVIEQGIDNDFISLIEKNTTDTKFDKENIKLIYAGGFYENLREPFELYKALKSIDLPVKLDIFGAIKNHFLPPNSEIINYKGYVPSIVVWKNYLKTDIIVFIDNFYGIHVPGKTVECLSLKKPILFIYENENSPTLDFMRHSTGVYYAKNNQKEISKALNEIISNLGKTEITFNNSRYIWNTLGEKITDAII